MLIVALTGGIATGKSLAAAVFQELGCFIHNSDEVAHALIEPKKPAWKKIVTFFGKEILKEDQTINRVRLGKLVFANQKNRSFLDQLLHPLVFNQKQAKINSLKKDGRYKIFISEAALTIEAGFIDFFDKTVITYCDHKTQISRLCKRDGISGYEAQTKIDSQMSIEEKKKYADYLIDTSGSILSTIEQSKKVYRQLISDYTLLKRRS